MSVSDERIEARAEARAREILAKAKGRPGAAMAARQAKLIAETQLRHEDALEAARLEGMREARKIVENMPIVENEYVRAYGDRRAREALERAASKLRQTSREASSRQIQRGDSDMHARDRGVTTHALDIAADVVLSFIPKEPRSWR